MADIKKGLAQQGDSVPKLPDVVVKLGLETFQGQMKAAGIAVTEFKDSKVVVNAAVGVKDAKLAEEWKNDIETLGTGLLATSELDLVSKTLAAATCRACQECPVGCGAACLPGTSPNPVSHRVTSPNPVNHRAASNQARDPDRAGFPEATTRIPGHAASGRQ